VQKASILFATLSGTSAVSALFYGERIVDPKHYIEVGLISAIITFPMIRILLLMFSSRPIRDPQADVAIGPSEAEFAGPFEAVPEPEWEGDEDEYNEEHDDNYDYEHDDASDAAIDSGGGLAAILDLPPTSPVSMTDETADGMSPPSGEFQPLPPDQGGGPSRPASSSNAIAVPRPVPFNLAKQPPPPPRSPPQLNPSSFPKPPTIPLRVPATNATRFVEPPRHVGGTPMSSLPVFPGVPEFPTQDEGVTRHPSAPVHDSEILTLSPALPEPEVSGTEEALSHPQSQLLSRIRMMYIERVIQNSERLAYDERVDMRSSISYPMARAAAVMAHLAVVCYATMGVLLVVAYAVPLSRRTSQLWCYSCLISWGFTWVVLDVMIVVLVTILEIEKLNQRRRMKDHQTLNSQVQRKQTRKLKQMIARATAEPRLREANEEVLPVPLPPVPPSPPALGDASAG